MNRSLTLATALCLTMTLTSHVIHAQSSNPALLQPEHIFELEYADDPRISPDGSEIVYVRTSMDIMTDRAQTNLWITNYDGSKNNHLRNTLNHMVSNVILQTKNCTHGNQNGQDH